MTRYVALLRGIAPALPHNSNAELRAVHEGLGLEWVGSWASGRHDHPLREGAAGPARA